MIELKGNVGSEYLGQYAILHVCGGFEIQPAELEQITRTVACVWIYVYHPASGFERGGESLGSTFIAAGAISKHLGKQFRRGEAKMRPRLVGMS